MRFCTARWFSSPAQEKVKISLLSGFLGSGKTTLLKQLLENKGGLRVGVVVNDVAQVNIDAKLVRERSSSGIRTTSGEGVDFVELENGCACCNASDELMACIWQLQEMAKARGNKFDRIVIEMSGVAEPKNIRREFQEALREGHPIFQETELSTMITVVDSPHFFDLYSARNDIADREELIGGEDRAVERYDDMKSIEVERKVVDLLVEQVECADKIVLNKTDRVDDKQRKLLGDILHALNPSASVFHCEFGNVPLEEVFGSESSAAAAADDDEDIRRAVRLAQQTQADAAAHGHGHGHAHAAHGHEHGHAHAEQGHAEHGHGHEHGHAHATTAADKYGISTFVYSRRKPFHPKKLQTLIQYLPVKGTHRESWIDHAAADTWHLDKLVGRAGRAAEEEAQEGKEKEGKNEMRLLHAVIRSKGFVWLPSNHQSALYWSHAGAHFVLHPLGQWWAASPKESWPEGGAETSEEVGKIMAEFDLSGRWGDRRQEIVFIGIGMDQAGIEALLDAALLSDAEMSEFASFVSTNQPPDPVAVIQDAAAPSGLKVEPLQSVLDAHAAPKP